MGEGLEISERRRSRQEKSQEKKKRCDARLDERVQQLVRVNDSLSVVGHQTNDGGVPLVDDLGEGGRSRGHEDLSDSVVELLHSVVRDSKESLSGPLLGLLVVKIPDRVLEREGLRESSDLREDSDLEATH